MRKSKVREMVDKKLREIALEVVAAEAAGWSKVFRGKDMTGNKVYMANRECYCGQRLSYEDMNRHTTI